MNNLEKWLLGIPLDKIDSYEALKTQILSHTSRDYLFFPFLLGYMERFHSESNEGLSLKELTLLLIFELLNDQKVEVYFVDSKKMELAKWETKAELIKIINRIKLEWENCGDKEPEMNDVIWIIGKEINKIDVD